MGGGFEEAHNRKCRLLHFDRLPANEAEWQNVALAHCDVPNQRRDPVCVRRCEAVNWGHNTSCRTAADVTPQRAGSKELSPPPPTRNTEKNPRPPRRLCSWSRSWTELGSEAVSSYKVEEARSELSGMEWNSSTRGYEPPWSDNAPFSTCVQAREKAHKSWKQEVLAKKGRHVVMSQGTRRGSRLMKKCVKTLRRL